MTGERLVWFRLAAFLRVPVQELKGRLAYDEFLEWVAYMEREEVRTPPDHLYLAQIATEVCRSRIKNPKRVRVSDFLLKPKTQSGNSSGSSKAIWARSLGIKLPPK